MLKVAKFGGSSLADARCFLQVRDIVRADPARRVVVVSAAGKRTSDDNKITDLLGEKKIHAVMVVDENKHLLGIVDNFRCMI